jgi:hypothetical protein
VDLDAEGVEHGGFGVEGDVGAGGVWGICDVDMVGAVAAHELVAGDAVEDGMDDGPLVGGRTPAAFGFIRGKAHDGAETEVNLKCTGLYEHAAPDDLARLANAFERTSAEGEIHGRLALTMSAGVTSDEVVGGRGAGDLEEPDELVEGVSTVVLAPSNIVEGGRWIVAKSTPDKIGDESVDSGTFVDFIEVGKWDARVEFGGSPFGKDGWALGVVEETFNEV